MNSMATLFQLALLMMIPPTPTVGDHVYIMIERHTDSYTDFLGRTIPAVDREVEVWIGDRSMAISSGPDRYIVDLERGLMSMLNTDHQVYISFPLPLDLESHLDEFARLRYQRYWMRFRVYGAMAGSVREMEDHQTILQRDCKAYRREDRSGAVTTIWATTDLPFDVATYQEMNRHLRTLRQFNNSGEFQAELDRIQGLPLLTESRRPVGGAEALTVSKVVALETRSAPDGIYAIPGGYHEKDKLKFAELSSGSLGPAERLLINEEEEVLSTLRKFQEGFIERDTSVLEEWVDDLMTEDVFIVGAEGTYPGEWEWRGGRDAAIEVFGGDWRGWGDVKLYLDEADIEVEENVAWVSLFLTVTRVLGRPGYRDAETMRQAILPVLRSKLDMDWSSRRILYEIIHDASWGLVEYERSDEFVWPMRLTMGLVKRDDRWLIRQMHWSYPGEGYPLLKLIEYEKR